MASNKGDITVKEEALIQDVLAGESQRQAYKNNYNAKRMKDTSIDVAVCRIMAKPKVRLRYNELKAELQKKAEQEGLMTATEVLRKLNELILRNEKIDDRIALEGIKTYGKTFPLFTDKVEHSGEISMPTIKISK